MHHEVVSQTSSCATGSNKEILTSKRDLDVGKEKECESSLEKNVEKEKELGSQSRSAVSESSSSKIEATVSYSSHSFKVALPCCCCCGIQPQCVINMSHYLLIGQYHCKGVFTISSKK